MGKELLLLEMTQESWCGIGEKVRNAIVIDLSLSYVVKTVNCVSFMFYHPHPLSLM